MESPAFQQFLVFREDRVVPGLVRVGLTLLVTYLGWLGTESRSQSQTLTRIDQTMALIQQSLPAKGIIVTAAHIPEKILSTELPVVRGAPKKSRLSSRNLRMQTWLRYRPVLLT